MPARMQGKTPSQSHESVFDTICLKEPPSSLRVNVTIVQLSGVLNTRDVSFALSHRKSGLDQFHFKVRQDVPSSSSALVSLHRGVRSSDTMQPPSPIPC